VVEEKPLTALRTFLPSNGHPKRTRYRSLDATLPSWLSAPYSPRSSATKKIVVAVELSVLSLFDISHVFDDAYFEKMEFWCSIVRVEWGRSNRLEHICQVGLVLRPSTARKNGDGSKSLASAGAAWGETRRQRRPRP